VQVKTFVVTVSSIPIQHQFFAKSFLNSITFLSRQPTAETVDCCQDRNVAVYVNGCYKAYHTK